MDDYSRYPVAEIIPSVSALSVIPVMRKWICLYGVHECIRSDNGSLLTRKNFLTLLPTLVSPIGK